MTTLRVKLEHIISNFLLSVYDLKTPTLSDYEQGEFGGEIIETAPCRSHNPKLSAVLN